MPSFALIFYARDLHPACNQAEGLRRAFYHERRLRAHEGGTREPAPQTYKGRCTSHNAEG